MVRIYSPLIGQNFTLFLLLIKRFAIVSTGWKTNNSATPSSNTSMSTLEIHLMATLYRMRQTRAHGPCPTLCPSLLEETCLLVAGDFLQAD